jgi:hypothetical protein
MSSKMMTCNDSKLIFFKKEIGEMIGSCARLCFRRVAFYTTVSSSPIQEISLRFDLTPDQIRKEADDLISGYQSTIDSLSALSSPTFETLIRPLSRAESGFFLRNANVDFPQYVSTSQEVSSFCLWLNYPESLYRPEKPVAKATNVSVNFWLRLA